MTGFTILATALAALLAALYAWAFRALPTEGRQFLAAAPVRRDETGAWAGVNFTYYGFFSATAYALATALFLVLMGSTGAPLAAGLAVAGLLLAVCAPASRWVARWVEGRRDSFTVGGASFVGVLAAPAILLGMDRWAGPPLGFRAPLEAGLAALSISYVLGEGVGRLACISFGCCYGKPVAETRGALRRFCERFPFVFEGKTKKIAFASGLDGRPVVPVQALTATIHGGAAVLGVLLYGAGSYRAAIASALTVALLWRIASETLRADYRGDQKISAYQIMAAASLLLVWSGLLLPGAATSAPDLRAGLLTLWSPAAILFVQGVWLATFFYMGRSTQTRSTLSFSLRRERV